VCDGCEVALVRCWKIRVAFYGVPLLSVDRKVFGDASGGLSRATDRVACSDSNIASSFNVLSC
jgi:hypothetical protein